MQIGSGIGEQHKVVHIADIPGYTERFFDKVVKSVEIDVGPKLAGQIADGKTAPPRGGREQVVAGIPYQMRFLRVGIVYDAIYEPKGIGASDFPADFLFQNLVVKAGKKLFDVALQHIRVPPRIMLVPFNRLMGSLADAVGIGIVDKRFFKNRFHDLTKGMVYHPISKRRGADKPALGVVDIKGGVRARVVGFGFELGLEAEKQLSEMSRMCRAGMLRRISRTSALPI